MINLISKTDLNILIAVMVILIISAAMMLYFLANRYNWGYLTRSIFSDSLFRWIVAGILLFFAIILILSSKFIVIDDTKLVAISVLIIPLFSIIIAAIFAYYFKKDK